MDDNGTGRHDDLSAADHWPMGAVSRRTGLSEHTLRAWERRFGFPDPVRLPSGHRRYPKDQVRRLLLINRVLASGHRAGDVVPQPVEELERLLRDSEDTSALTPEESTRRWLTGLNEAVLDMDAAAIARALASEAAKMGAQRFLRERATPLLVEIGEAWARGELAIRHEHLLSELLEDCLRTIRLGLESASHGRPVVLACLPDEQHTLGLHLAALEIAAAGRQLRLLGPRTPLDELAAAARTVNAAAVALSISIYADPESTLDHLSELRRLLPERIGLWVGGGGARQLRKLPNGVVLLDSLDELADELGKLEASKSSEELE